MDSAAKYTARDDRGAELREQSATVESCWLFG
jgi:hypothetical protein